jgi:Peptidase family C25
MKKHILIFFSFCVYALTGFSQQNKRAEITNSSESYKIEWKSTIQQDIPGIGKHSILTFYNAQYEMGKHLFPIYSTRIELPAGAINVDVEIGNESYLPLSDSEVTAMNSYDIQKKNYISTRVTPEALISSHRKTKYAYIQFVPIRKNKQTGKYEKMISFSLKTSPVYTSKIANQNTVSKSNVPTSILASGKWYKISVTADGIYKMDYLFLKSMGIDVNHINPKNIRVYGNGGGQLPFANSGFRYDDLQENAIAVKGENDGKLDSADYVLFYGQSQHRWAYNKTDNRFHHVLNVYSDTTYYFITTDIGTGKRITAQNSSTGIPGNNVTDFDDYQFHESEAVNLIKSGRLWLGETFDILTTYNFTFNFANIETTVPVYARIEMAARADGSGTSFSWTAGPASSSFNVGSVNTSDIYGTYYRMLSDSLVFIPNSGTIPLSVSKITPSPSIGWLNHIEINVRRGLTMSGSGDQMNFRDARSVGAGNISRFIISDVAPSLEVWDVTNPIDVKMQQGSFSGNTFEFTLVTDKLREFSSFNGQSFLSPKTEGEVKNQNLHGMPQSELIIVSNPLFLEQANMLADLHRREDKLSVSVATTDEVYNEFSGGAQDVSAIRDFARMFYARATNATQLPKYLLLIGRGSYNVKARINNTNFVPAYESMDSENPTSSYPSDDFYGMLDTNEGAWDNTPDMLDIGVGRLPVTSVNQANSTVNKIIKYYSVPGTIETGNSCSSDICYGLGDWVNYVTFIADDEDGGEYVRQAEALSQRVDTGNSSHNVDKIYFDSFQQISTPGGDRYPDANAAFAKRMDKGSWIVNYTGHGGPLGLAHERFLEIHDINSWKNQCKLPFFFTATCDFSTWDDPGRISSGELTLLNPDGGGIGLMSTTRVVYSQPNFTLNSHFYEHLFSLMPNGKRPRLGDLHMLTKNDIVPSQINQRNFSLLADPALTLHYPGFSVLTTSVNGIPAGASGSDTIRALSKVTVQGEIRDKNGNLQTNFNGIIYPTVFDKAAKINTLSNDPGSPVISFYMQKNTIFKGKASVTNGIFSFSFIVPKDIAYNFGNGKISYYAHNGYEDANGSFRNFIVGGADTSSKTDMVGPEIKLFMNDDKFVIGGITNSDPKIYAVLSDSNGINTAGSSIGHDITAVLDGNNAHPIILNDYYEATLNNYKSGTVRYPLTGLAEGNHTLMVKVWDVYNNSSTSTTEFLVSPSAQLALKHVLNYPNPFTTKTSFFFEHNKCCTSMDVQVQIFTVSGKLIKTIQQRVTMEGFRSEAIDWDGTDDFGDKIGRGVYIYRLRVRTNAGETSEKFEKLVILK